MVLASLNKQVLMGSPGGCIYILGTPFIVSDNPVILAVILPYPCGDLGVLFVSVIQLYRQAQWARCALPLFGSERDRLCVVTRGICAFLLIPVLPFPFAWLSWLLLLFDQV